MLAAETLPTTSIPTRVTNVTAPLIDNIFSTLSLKENSILVYDISDPFPIYSRFSFKQCKNSLARVLFPILLGLVRKSYLFLGLNGRKTRRACLIMIKIFLFYLSHFMNYKRGYS